MSDRLNSEQIEEFISFATQLADAAAQVTLAHFRKPIEVSNKEAGVKFDPVTVADKAAERAMRDLIESRYPDHTVIGEEYEETVSSGRYSWVLDPIDGTRAYIMGLPTWGTLIALLVDGEPVIGIIDQPYIKERFIGSPNGTTLNGNPIHCSSCDSLSDAKLSTTAFEVFSNEEAAAYNALAETVKLNRGEFDCYSYAMVAHGMIDIVAEAGMKIFDIMALVPVIRGAGGLATNWHGDESFEDGRLLTCGDRRMQTAALEILSSVPKT